MAEMQNWKWESAELCIAKGKAGCGRGQKCKTDCGKQEKGATHSPGLSQNKVKTGHRTGPSCFKLTML